MSKKKNCKHEWRGVSGFLWKRECSKCGKRTKDERGLFQSKKELIKEIEDGERVIQSQNHKIEILQEKLDFEEKLNERLFNRLG